MKPPARFTGSEDYLHEVAAKECGLTDFGEGADYLPGLGVLLASMDVDPRFTPEGRQLAFDAVVITLIARAYAEEGWKRHPEWREAPIRAPIIIAGMSRTGTTALHKLMGADPQFQGLEHWLSQSPMPRPPRSEWPANPAYRRAARWVDDMFAASPESQVAHNFVADEYEECLELQRQNFTCNRWTCTWTAPSYDAWWQTQSEERTFARSADILRLIGCHDERRWLLKNPSNIEFLDYVFDHFPDACIIQTHRHPLKFMPSICSLVHLSTSASRARVRRRAATSSVREPMTERQIEEVIDSFGRAAENSKGAGFDGVELHGAHGYLIDQFFWDVFNKREDGYGGTMRNRARFGAEVVAEVRSRVGQDFPVAIRISQEDAGL